MGRDGNTSVYQTGEDNAQRALVVPAGNVIESELRALRNDTDEMSKAATK